MVGQHDDLAAMDAGPRRVLVVDDEAIVRRMLADLLQWFGLEAEICSYPREALARLDDTGVDLLVTDLRMPEMSGWDLIEAARARHPHLAVLIITGVPSLSALQRARQAGFRLLPKPFTMTAFETAVRDALAPAAHARRG